MNLEQLEVRAGGSDFVDVAQTAGGRLPLLTRVSLALCPSQAAIARADARNRLVCVKYYAPWCQSCFAIKPLYERAAEGKMAEYVDFYEVDGGCARELVALADVRNFPVTQVYARGSLRTTRPINSKALFDEFYARLEDLVLEFADFSATVEGAG